MAIRVRVVVRGRVHGVFYRDTCNREARRLGLSGWVRNCADGTVEIEAEGGRDAVDALLRWAQVGPPRASVTSMQVEDLAPIGDASFRVM